MVMPFRLHMRSYVLETFTEYPSLGIMNVVDEDIGDGVS